MGQKAARPKKRRGLAMGLALLAKGVILKRNDLGRRGPGGARLTSSPPYRGAPTIPLRYVNDSFDSGLRVSSPGEHQRAVFVK